MQPETWAFAADVLTVLHGIYALWIVLFVPAIWWADFRGHAWARNPWIRFLHLAGMLMVPLEDALGVPCPVTAAERYCRARGGQVAYEGDFLAHAAHSLLYFRAPQSVFVALHVGFALVVILTFWKIRPRFTQPITAAGPTP